MMVVVDAPDSEPAQTQGWGSGVVEATERLYRSLFTAAVAYAVATWVWGACLAPFNGFKDDKWVAAVLCMLAAAIAAVGLRRRDRLFYALRAQPAWLLVPAAASIAVMWADGGWHSTAYLATYAPILMAVVVASPRWAISIGALMAVGYASGVLVHGYTPDRVQELKDLELSIANVAGYIIAAVFFALPVRWLGNYVARINQVISAPSGAADLARDRTKSLTVREVEITQLVAEGLTNDAIAERLVLSPRTVQSHVANALHKTAAGSRTELAMVAVREGLVPLVLTSTSGADLDETS